jgi:hypothetical protein
MAATLTPDELGDRLVELLEGGDPSVLIEHLAPGAVLWHNDDKRSIDAIAGVQAVAGLNCIVVRTADAGIVRIDEYVDPTLLAQLGLGEPKEVSP